MRIVALASGSKGNAYLVEHGGEAILIDCGIAYRNFRNVEFSAILVTHSHADHVSGLPVLLKHRDLPVYANAMTAETVAHDLGIDPGAFVCFENGQDFPIGPFTVHPFSIPHDTSDPVGYLVSVRDAESGTRVYFHGTDIGTPLDSIGLKFAAADYATLESNHDSVMLRRSGRPPSLIQRIAGPRGHLSNDQACGLVERFATSRLKALGLAHLSHDCNQPHLAEGAMRTTLAARGLAGVALKVYSQDAAVELT